MSLTACMRLRNKLSPLWDPLGQFDACQSWEDGVMKRSHCGYNFRQKSSQSYHRRIDLGAIKVYRFLFCLGKDSQPHSLPWVPIHQCYNQGSIPGCFCREGGSSPPGYRWIGKFNYFLSYTSFEIQSNGKYNLD